MPIYRVRVRKKHDTKLIEWENRYYVDADSLTTASFAANTVLVAAEQAVHNAGITIIRVITSDLPEGGDFVSVPLNQACENGVAGDELPGILTLNVAFDKVGFGRNDGKFYHVFWGETGQAAGLWSDTPLNAAGTVLTNMLDDMTSAGASLCDIEGHLWSSATPIKEVGHHKFSKRSKRAIA
jgi:hypothetical protein